MESNKVFFVAQMSIRTHTHTQVVGSRCFTFLKTSSSPLKSMAWKIKCPFGLSIFRDRLFVSRRIPSQSLTWNLKIILLKRKFIFNNIIFGFHVKFGECNVLPISFTLSFRSSRNGTPPLHMVDARI